MFLTLIVLGVVVASVFIYRTHPYLIRGGRGPMSPKERILWPAKGTPIHIERIYTDVNPTVKERLCRCGGTLRYGPFTYRTFLDYDRRDVTIDEVYGYRCDNSGCNTTIFPLPVAQEMEYRINQAKGELSLKQRLVGRIKGYHSISGTQAPTK
jgi:hypothetical protein